jgi:hypothetical protein
MAIAAKIYYINTLVAALMINGTKNTVFLEE